MDPGAPPADGGALLDGLALSITNLLGDEPDELPSAIEGGLDAKPVAVPEARSIPAETETRPTESAGDEEPKDGKKRRRRRRRKRRGEGAPETAEAEANAADLSDAGDATADAPSEEKQDEPPVKLVVENETPAEPVAPAAPPAEAKEPEPEPEPAVVADTPTQPVTTEPVLETTAKPKKKKRGWWSR